MKTIFDQLHRNELIERLKLLQDNNQAQWGKMNILQMTKHCCLWDSWILGKNVLKNKQVFMGKIFGKIALRSMIKNDKPFSKNIPAGKALEITDNEGDLDSQKDIWINLIREYENFSNDNFIHDFFGRMTRAQIGILAYKHTDHHLRQFGA